MDVQNASPHVLIDARKIAVANMVTRHGRQMRMRRNRPPGYEPASIM
jgi:hypothetical protein